MITTIKKAFAAKYSNLVVAHIFDAGNGRYIVEAVPDLNSTYISDPFYLYDSKNGSIVNYFVMNNFDEFARATESGMIYAAK